MTDVFTAEKRSKVMQKIKSKDTKPEMIIRRGLHRLGRRFKLHDKNLPGKPDIVFPMYRTVIQVRGCFWHGHECNDGHIPKSHQNYWKPKLAKTKERDTKNDKLLEDMGWNVIVVWECLCSTKQGLENVLRRINAELKKAGDLLESTASQK